MFNRARLVLLTILVGSCSGGENTSTLPELPPVICIATLTWEYPVAMLDGTIISQKDLQKLTIYVNEMEGYNQETLEMVEDILDVNIISWEIKPLSPGVHWFYLTVTDVKNIESGYSNEMNKIC